MEAAAGGQGPTAQFLWKRLSRSRSRVPRGFAVTPGPPWGFHHGSARNAKQPAPVCAPGATAGSTSPSISCIITSTDSTTHYRAHLLIVLLLAVVLAFSLMCYLMFGAEWAAMSNPLAAIFNQFEGALGGLDLSRAEESEGFVGWLIVMSFIVLVVIVILNLIIAIMNEEYSTVYDEASIQWCNTQWKMIQNNTNQHPASAFLRRLCRSCTRPSARASGGVRRARAPRTGRASPSGWRASPRRRRSAAAATLRSRCATFSTSRARASSHDRPSPS